MMDTTADTVARRERPRWKTLPAWTQDGERVAIYLLILFLAAWLLTMLTIQAVVIVHHHGLGLGIGDHQHVPASIVKQIGVGDNVEKMMKATNKP